MIPGLEFKDGLCPMCQTKEIVTDFKSVLLVINQVGRNKKSRFDIALFYTGCKDSSFLLYYLSKGLNLRVLALTWEIPLCPLQQNKASKTLKRNFLMLNLL